MLDSLTSGGPLAPCSPSTPTRTGVRPIRGRRELMALSRQSILALCAFFGGTGVLAALAMSPAVAGGGAAAPFAGGGGAPPPIQAPWGSGGDGGPGGAVPGP